MNLKSLLLSSDDKTVRVLRRVLNDLDIDLEHSSASDDIIRRLTRNRFEAIIVDCIDPQDAGNVLRATKAAPVNKRALSIVLAEGSVGLKDGFDMGAHFVLHKPLTVERAKSSFRAVRALMKSERRLQMRVPVQVPVECVGASTYPARTLDLCEGGMAIQFTSRKAKEKLLRFTFTLPGTSDKLDLWGEIAWEGTEDQAGIRFQNPNDKQRNLLRDWLNRQVAQPEPDDPPLACRLRSFSEGGCYLTSSSPFPKSTRVILSLSSDALEVRASAIVRIAHPEFGMGVEFVQSTRDQKNQVRHMLEALRAGGKSAELRVDPDGLESTAEELASKAAAEDALVSLFRAQSELSVDAFLKQMEQHPQLQHSH